MKIYDISQELTGCAVYSGDKAPQKELVSDMDKGDFYNLTNISICTHNGTHIDAPCHFINKANSISDIPLEKFIGECIVIHHDGEFTSYDAEKLCNETTVCPKRILIGGKAVITADAAREFVRNGIFLVGNESQSVGPENAPAEVHKILLSKGIVLLEGIRLANVAEGKYFLSAAPINIDGSDGSPCRAILLDLEA